MKRFGERQKFLKQKHRRKNFIYADEILNEPQSKNQFLSSFVHGEYVFKIFIKSQSYKLRKQGELFCCSFSLYYLQKPIDFASSPKVDFNAYMNSKARTSCLQFQGLARLFLALLLICSFFEAWIQYPQRRFDLILSCLFTDSTKVQTQLECSTVSDFVFTAECYGIHV